MNTKKYDKRWNQCLDKYILSNEISSVMRNLQFCVSRKRPMEQQFKYEPAAVKADRPGRLVSGWCGSVVVVWGLSERLLDTVYSHVSGILVEISWWRHQMETFSALLAICAGNSPVPGEFPAQRPVTRGFDVFFDLRPNKRLSKQWWGWWFETPSWSLWCHRNVFMFDRWYFFLSNRDISQQVDSFSNQNN